MKRKLLSMLLVVVTVFSLLPFGAVAANDSTEYNPVFNSSWTLAQLKNDQYYYKYLNDYYPIEYVQGAEFHMAYLTGRTNNSYVNLLDSDYIVTLPVSDISSHNYEIEYFYKTDYSFKINGKLYPAYVNYYRTSSSGYANVFCFLDPDLEAQAAAHHEIVHYSGTETGDDLFKAANPYFNDLVTLEETKNLIKFMGKNSDGSEWWQTYASNVYNYDEADCARPFREQLSNAAGHVLAWSPTITGATYKDSSGRTKSLVNSSATLYLKNDPWVNKTLTRTDDGTYTITMEAYARNYFATTKSNWTLSDFQNATYYYKDGDAYYPVTLNEAQTGMSKRDMLQQVAQIVQADFQAEYNKYTEAQHIKGTVADCESRFSDGSPQHLSAKWFVPTGIYIVNPGYYYQNSYQLFVNYTKIRDSDGADAYYIYIFFVDPVTYESYLKYNQGYTTFANYEDFVNNNWYGYGSNPNYDYGSSSAQKREKLIQLFILNREFDNLFDYPTKHSFAYHLDESTDHHVLFIDPHYTQFKRGPNISFTISSETAPYFIIQTDQDGNVLSNAISDLDITEENNKTVPGSNYEAYTNDMVFSQSAGLSVGGQSYYFDSNGNLILNDSDLTLYQKTCNSEVFSSLDDSAILRDVISNQFKLPSDIAANMSNYIKVQTQNMSQTSTSSAPAAVGNPTDVTAAMIAGNHVKVNGKTIEVTGFDYASNYVTYGHDGQKLIVTITGLKPTVYGENIPSNLNTSGIYKDGNLVIPFPVPTIDVPVPQETPAPALTYLIDFNGKMKLAKNGEIRAVGENNANGTFAENDGTVTYQLNAEEGFVNKLYAGVDTATIKGQFYSTEWKTDENGVFGAVTTAESEPTLRDVTVIPAGSIYYDDNLASETAAAITVGDGSGYNVEIAASPATESMSSGLKTFKFYGTRIDVYCTTQSDGGLIQAKIDNNTATAFAMRNSSDVTRYNVPTVSFTGLTPGVEHRLTLNIFSVSNYKLDGIRVYNTVSDQNVYENAKSEQYATFINMRDALVNNKSTASFDSTTTNVGFGALYVDNRAGLERLESATQDDIDNPEIEIIYKDGRPMKNVYATDLAAYESNSPKNEIYLSNGQALTFQLTELAKGGKLWIGLSAPNADAQSGTVTINGTTVTVTSAVDMYYPITADMIGTGNSVTITNTTGNLISVTNLKVTGVESIYNAANMQQTAAVSESASALSIEDVIPLVFEPVTMQTVKLAANNGVDPDAVVVPTPTPDDPTPTPDDPTQDTLLDLIHQVISAFVRSLFSSISRLFP